MVVNHVRFGHDGDLLASLGAHTHDRLDAAMVDHDDDDESKRKENQQWWSGWRLMNFTMNSIPFRAISRMSASEIPEIFHSNNDE